MTMNSHTFLAPDFHTMLNHLAYSFNKTEFEKAINQLTLYNQNSAAMVANWIEDNKGRLLVADIYSLYQIKDNLIKFLNFDANHSSIYRINILCQDILNLSTSNYVPQHQRDFILERARPLPQEMTDACWADILKVIPPLADVIDRIKPLIQEIKNEYQEMRILRILQAISPEQRANVIQLASHFLKSMANEKEVVILYVIEKISQEQGDQFISDLGHLFKAISHENQRRWILYLLSHLAIDKCQEFFQFLQTIVASHIQKTEGITLLHIAAMQDNPEIAKLLLDTGANLHATCVNGTQPLHLAILNNKKEMAEFLLEKGANIEAKCSALGLTPLSIAIIYCGKEMVELLLERVVDLQVTTADFSTLLHIALLHTKKEIVELLIDKGISINEITDHGLTPFMTAYTVGYKDLGDKLYQLSSPDCQAWLSHKLLNHRFGLNIQVQEKQRIIKLETLPKQFAYFYLLDSIRKITGWLKQAPPNWTDQDSQTIFEAMSLAFDLTNEGVSIEERINKAIQAYQNKRIVIIPTGFKSHSTMTIFFGNFFVKGDRAYYIKENESDANLKIYKMRRPIELPQVFTRLLKNGSVWAISENKAKDKHYYYHEINHILDLKEKQQIKKSLQRGAVCSWTSAKMAFHGTLYLYLYQKFVEDGLSYKESRDQALRYSQNMYKVWMQEDRFIAVQNYMREVPENNPHKAYVLTCIYHHLCMKKKTKKKLNCSRQG